MNQKKITISIPSNSILPEEINSFSLEENYQMLKIGGECLLEGRKVVSGLSQKEICDKIKEEYQEELEKRQLEINMEKEVSKKMEERIKSIYEDQIEQLNKQIDRIKEKNCLYENQNHIFLQEEVNKVREKYDLLLQEKENQQKSTRETIEKLQESFTKLVNKSTAQKGSEGEKQFEDYADTFKDFNGYQIKDKHTQGGEGDFHLHFEEFDVLVDVKNYKKKIPMDEREKIKKDLMKNEHLPFAWLVSLNTSIDKYDRSPIMYEWINTKQCIVFINQLALYEDPPKILRVVWFTCKELNKFIKEENSNDQERIELKEKNYKNMDKIKSIRKTIREINTSINVTRNLIQVMDNELREILETETKEIIDSPLSLLEDWWNENIQVTNDDSIILSTDLWFKCRQDNKEYVKEMEISGEKFKQFIRTKVPLSCLKLKSKNIHSAIEIKGIKMKQQDNVLEIPEWIEEMKKQDLVSEIPKWIEEKEPIMITKSISKNKKKDDFYFDKELDEAILESYQEESKDILNIAKEFNKKVFEIVSVLMKHKIILKRNQAKGYSLYQESEEYKSKINKGDYI